MDLDRTRIVAEAHSNFVGRCEARSVVEVGEVDLDHRLVRPSAGGDVGPQFPGSRVPSVDLEALTGSMKHHGPRTISHCGCNSIEGFEKSGL